jgi:hypothetical protein
MVAEQWPTEEQETPVRAAWAGALARVSERIAHRFGRAEVRARVPRYLCALRARVERKNSWQLAEAMGEEGPWGVQSLLSTTVWDAEAVRDDLRAYGVEHRGDAPGGALIIDETSFPKKGQRSCGVAAQSCGTLGRSTTWPGRRLPGLRLPRGHGLRRSRPLSTALMDKRSAAVCPHGGAPVHAVRDQGRVGQAAAGAGLRRRCSG